MENVEIHETWGAVVAIATDNADITTRYWFDEKPDGTLKQFGEVIELPGGREYIGDDEMLVPPKVKEALEEHGYSCS